MNKASVEQSIEYIKKCFNNKIMTTNVLINNECVTWCGYKSGIVKGVSYPREYQILLDNRQYSFLLLDGSFFQFYFKFDENKLILSRIAYYPVPRIINETIYDLNEYEEDANPWLKDVFAEMALEMEYSSCQLSSNSHIRFDYDDSATTHSKSHLQFGGINEYRITSKVLLLPFVFFERILMDFFPDWFEDDFDKVNLVERKHGLNNCFRFDDEDSYYIAS